MLSSGRGISIAVVAMVLAAPLAVASHNWWNGSYYTYMDAWVNDDTLTPGQSFTLTVSYRQGYNGYSTLSAYQCCWSGRLAASGPHHANAGVTRTISMTLTAPSSAGTYDFYGFVLSAYSAYPTPDYRNGYAHVQVTVQQPVGTPTTPCVSESHTGGSWSTHNTPHWTWGCVTVSGGSVSRYEVQPSWGGSFLTTGTSYHPTLGTGSHWIKVRAQNNVGVWGGWSAAKYAHVDVTPPNAPSVGENHAGASGWSNHNHPNFYWANPGDAGSGVARYEGEHNGQRFNLGGAASWHPTLPDGQHTFRAFAIDGVGHVSGASNAVTVRIDTGPPTTTLNAGAPTAIVDGERWVTSATPLTLAAADGGCGVAATYRAVDGGATVAYSGAFTLGGADGAHSVAYWSSDCAGNTEARRASTLMLDNTAPDLALERPQAGVLYVDETAEARYAGALPTAPPTEDPIVVGDLLVRASAADAGVGVARVEFFVDGALAAADESAPFEFLWSTGSLALGRHALTVRAVDHLGNARADATWVTTFPTDDAGAVATAEATTGAEVPEPGPLPTPDDLPGQDDLPAPGEIPDPGELPDPDEVPTLPNPTDLVPEVPPTQIPPSVQPVVSVVADPASGSVTYRVGVMVNGQFVGVEGRAPPGG